MSTIINQSVIFSIMKTLIDTRIYALLSHNESNLLELTQAYKEFIEIMTEMIANCNDRDEILRILHYGRIEFDVLSHPMFNQYADNVLRTTFIIKLCIFSTAKLILSAIV